MINNNEKVTPHFADNNPQTREDDAIPLFHHCMVFYEPTDTDYVMSYFNFQYNITGNIITNDASATYSSMVGPLLILIPLIGIPLLTPPPPPPPTQSKFGFNTSRMCASNESVQGQITPVVTPVNRTLSGSSLPSAL